MNKRLKKQGKKAFTALLVICLMFVTLWGNSVRAEEGETVPAPVEVSSWDELQNAMEQASDGDVIKIMNPVNVPVGSNLGYSDKRITLQKGCQTGTVIFEWTDEPWVGSLIQNVVFDGAEIVGGGVYVSSNAHETFHNVSFINCYSESSPGALYTAGNTNIIMNYCTFENNKGLNGGHVMFGGSATLGNCILKNGYAAIRGGAICCGVGCVTLNDCIVTGNSAGFEGGGISNVQFNSTISIQNSKIYDNHADVGSDIFTNADYTIDTDLEALQALYESDGYTVTGWEITSVVKEENEYFAIKLGYSDTPVIPPTDEEQNQYYASNSSEFINYVSSAKDGDVITITDEINLGTDVQLGDDTKHLTVKRGTASSHIIMGVGCNIDVKNITFDGCGENAPDSFIQTSSTATFTDCTFMNCSDVEHISNSLAQGGVFNVQGGSGEFNNCIFKDNYGLIGGHMAIMNDSIVTLKGCTLASGGAVSNGGAVVVNSENATCHIIDCVITGNQALDYGGGVSNGGTLTVTGSKIYNNTATNGGADIATKITGNTTLNDTLEQLNELFGADNLQVTGWVCDYDFQENVYIPDVNPEQEKALLKLSYSALPPVTPPTDEPGTDNPPSEQPSDAPTGSPSDQGGTGGNNNQTTPPDTGNNGSSANNGNTGNPPSNNTPSNNSNSTVTSSDNSSTDTSDRSDNSTHTSNTTTTNDNSDRSTTTNNDTSDRSTVNNYYYTTTTPQAEQGQQSTSAAVNESDQNVGTASSDEENQEQGQENPLQTLANIAPNIKMDLKGVNCVLECDESGAYSISITSSDDDPVQNAQQESTHSEFPWLNVVQIILLAAILLSLIWQNKPRRQGNIQEQE